MATLRYRRSDIPIPKPLRDGAALAALPQSWIANKDERAVIVQLICQRRLFGLCYWMLQPDYFDIMPRGSGVLLSPLVPTSEVFHGINRPGDIDLLIVPYEGAELVLERAMAIEFKAIRASFKRQGKSPNEYGFSQGEALLALGIPYVAVGHMILSDESPPEHWREMVRAEVLDDEGRVGELSTVNIDMMPADLIKRALGRLEANTPSEFMGLLASYIELSDECSSTINYTKLLIPEARHATLNPITRVESLEAIAQYLSKNPNRFVNTPRHDP